MATQIPAAGRLAMVSTVQSCVDEAVAKTVNLLLMRRAGTDYGAGCLAFPAGHVDLGETPTASIFREAREELGITMLPTGLTPAGVMFRRSLEPRVDFFFTADTWHGTPRICEPHKCTELIWGAPFSLPPGTLDYIGPAIANLDQGRHFCEYGWAATLS